MLRSANSAFTRVFDPRRGALLFRRKAIIALTPWAFPSGS
jgi:hypothetical protein